MLNKTNLWSVWRSVVQNGFQWDKIKETFYVTKGRLPSFWRIQESISMTFPDSIFGLLFFVCLFWLMAPFHFHLIDSQVFPVLHHADTEFTVSLFDFIRTVVITLDPSK